MTHNEIRVVKYLAEAARDIKQIEPGWAWENWTAFQMVMLKQKRPEGALYEVTDKQFEKCLVAAWMEMKR